MSNTLSMYSKQRLEVSAIILLYHGVTNHSSKGIENFSKKHLPYDEFKTQIRYLKNNANVMTLRKFTERLQRQEALLPNSVAVTFDDSFRNIHDVALPVLKEYQVPATFFVSTGFIGTNRLFWVDMVEHVINMTRNNYIEIKLFGKMKGFSLVTPSEKITAVIEIKKALKQMGPHKRNKILSALRECTRVPDDSDPAPNYANLSWEDVRNLDLPPYYEVGSHTVNHEVLSTLDEELLHYEIEQSINDLERNLGHPVDLFSYPEGQSEHFNDHVVDLLKQTGIKICPTAISGINYPGIDPFHLKRMMVGFMGEKFPFQMIGGGTKLRSLA
ncbi:MAG: polysaccharide deacetylase family protein [Thermodesulfobacteriota bacterium]|nr:polysaccharide deacetylase family protein [Thermodesulfobacteriota bacterium]